MGYGIRLQGWGNYVAFACTTALNHLLEDFAHRQVIGDTTVVYWAKTGGAVYQDMLHKLMFVPEDPNLKLNEILKKVALGQKVDSVEFDTDFYILGLSPNAARLSVRFSFRAEFGKILSNIAKHYDRLEIAKAPFEKEYLSVYALLNETINPNAKEEKASSNLAGATFRAIIEGTRYPAALYNGVMLRIGAERKVTRGRAAYHKGIFINFEQSR